MRTEQALDDSRFRLAFARIVEPVLRDLDFHRVIPPPDWLAPTELFEVANKWVGASWDWRDNYLQVDVGRLFTFRDVMPRVIIIGPLRRDIDCAGHPESFLEEQLARVARQLPTLVSDFESRIEASLSDARRLPTESTEKQRQVVAEYAVRIGSEVMLERWAGATVG